MAVQSFEYDHKKVKVTLNLLPLTAFTDNITVAEGGEDWSVSEGLYDTVQYSKRSNNVCTVTLPMNQNSAEFIVLKGFRALKTGMPFAMVDLNNGDTILGEARIMSMGEKSVGVDATGRTVTLSVVKKMEA